MGLVGKGADKDVKGVLRRELAILQTGEFGLI